MASSAKDLKKTLGRMNLMSMAVGQIIGSGVMVMSIVALGMTGRSVNIAFVVAAVLTCIGALPTIYMGSTIRVYGGFYSQAAIFVGDKYAGFYIVTYIFSNCSMAMYATGLASYLGSLIPALADKQMIVAIVVFIAFTVLNFFGTDKIAKVQDLMFYLLVAALLMFTIFGVPKVQWAGYFGNELFGAPLFNNGVSGLLEAASYLTFATGGATIILNFSAEAINPTKDIPFVVIVSTVSVAILYAFMASCIGGILPAEQVIEAGNLSVIAKEIMPTPCYYFFIICGACFALGTTLNASLGWVTKPLLQATADGWFPAALGKLNKHGVPATWLLIFAVVNIAAIISGMNISMLGKLTLLINNVNNFVLAFGITRLPKLFPEAWEKSPFHVSNGALYVTLGLAMAVLVMQAYMNCKGQAPWVLIANAIMFVVALVYANVMVKGGKIHMTPSYDLE